MSTVSKLTREEFLSSHFLKISLIDIEKSLLHHNRFVFQIVSDRNKQLSKKKYSEIKRFSEQMHTKMGMKEFILESHLRSSEQYKTIENLFKKINSGYLMNKDTVQGQLQLRTQVRNYLYNLLYDTIQQNGASSQDEAEVSKIISIGKNSPEIQNKKIERERQQSFALEQSDGRLQKKERSSDNKLGFREAIKNIYKPKKQGDQLRRLQMLKTIKSIWVVQNEVWMEKLFSVNENCLVYYEKETAKKIILLKNLDILFEEKDYVRIIISHPLLKTAIQVRLSSLLDISKDTLLSNQYYSLFYALKEAAGKREQEIFSFFCLKITNKKNKFTAELQKRPAKQLSIKITTQTEAVVTTFAIQIDSTLSILLPIYNNYGKFNMLIVEQRQGGILPISKNSIEIPIPVQNIYDQMYNQKPKRKVPDVRNHLIQSKQCNYSIKLEYFELANFHSYFACTFKDKFEGEEIPTEFSRDQLRIQKNRFHRIAFTLQHMINQIKSLKNWQYPLRSLLFYFTIFVAIFLFDANCLLHYTLTFLCILLIWYHPTSSSYARQVISLFKLDKFLQFLQAKLDERAYSPRFKVCFKKDIQKRLFLQNFNMNTKKKRNILQKYNRLLEILLKGQLYLTQMVTITEKIKNLFTWYHHKKTKQFFIVLLIALVLILFVPLRLIALFALYKMYNKGIVHHQKSRTLNRIILYQIFKLTIEQSALTELRIYLHQQTKPYDKKSSQYMTFQKRLKENLSEILQIDFDHQIFVQGRTFSQLLSWLSDCKKRFIIRQEMCIKYRFSTEWSISSSSLLRFIQLIYSFLINIPSDRNIIGVKAEGQPQNNEQDSQDFD